MKGRLLSLLAAVVVLTASGPHGRAPTRWALIVGISDYTHFGDEIGGDLPGAVNDARNLRDVLVARWGFPADNVKLLLDAEATRTGIEQGLTQWLPSVARPGDLVLFFFAGHGSQAWDTNGDEPDGLDETICPADVQRGSTAQDIVDDELGAWLGRIPSENLVVVWDKCHAESSTRAVTPFSRPRSLNRNVAADVPKPAGVAAPGAVPSQDAPARNVLELAASQADEVAVDAAWQNDDGSEPTFGGAFTTFFVRNLWQLPSRTSYEEVFDLTLQDLKRERFAQTPSISRPETRAVFALEGAATKAAADEYGALPVVAVPAAGEIELGGGSAAGITVGSVYRVSGVLLRVTSVSGDRARAVATDKAAAAKVAPGSRASLVAYKYPEAVLRVSVADLGPEARAAVRRQVGTTPGITLFDDPRAFAHLIIRPQQDRTIVLGLDGATRHMVAAQPAAGAAQTLGNILKQELGAHQLAALENPAHPYPLDMSFGDGKRRFKLGDRVSFRAKPGKDGYLTIVDLGTDGTVTVLFPNELDRNSAVRAGQDVYIPALAMNTEFEAQPPVGRGIVRAFLTEQPLTLPFEQGDASQAEAVSRALRQAVGKAPVAGTDALSVRNWATASVVYEIVK